MRAAHNRRAASPIHVKASSSPCFGKNSTGPHRRADPCCESVVRSDPDLIPDGADQRVRRRPTRPLSARSATAPGAGTEVTWKVSASDTVYTPLRS